jgi:hypothetical protein
MPVQAADIVEKAMNTGLAVSTGCEESSIGSVECVGKRAGHTNGTLVSNKIHIAKLACHRKAWKSGPKASWNAHKQSA